MALAMDQIDRGHDHAGGAEAALQAVVFAKSFLHRMQRRAVGGQPLDGANLMAVGHDSERGAGFHRLAVEMHDAGAALRGVAADMGARQPQIFPQQLDQQGTGVDIGVYGVTVHDQGNLGHQHSLELHRRISAAQAFKVIPNAIIWANPVMSNLRSPSPGAWPE